MGNDEISYTSREKLTQSLDSYRSILMNMTESYNQCLAQYRTSMQNAFQENKLYFNHTDLVKIHQKSKRDALSQVRNAIHSLIICIYLYYRLAVLLKISWN